MSSTEEAESVDSEVDLPITRTEVAKVVKKLHGGRTQKVDDISPEFLKALDLVGLFLLIHLYNIEWTSGAVPLDWQTGVVVPLFKKRDWRVCSSYTGITVLSLPGQVYAGCWRKRFTVECEAAMMRMSISKSETMVLS